MTGNDPARARPGEITFAFYGRVGCDATSESAARQRHAAERWLQERGWRIASVYIDAVPRTTPWATRPQARALLNACTQPERAFTAVVTVATPQTLGPGDPGPVIALLGQHGVPLWAPEFGGAADTGNGQHQLVICILGQAAPPGARPPGGIRPRPGRANCPCPPRAAPQKRGPAR